MSGVDLAAELGLAMNQLGPADRIILLKHGVNPDDIDQLCGIARIRITNEGLYEPDECGSAAVITPVRIDQLITPESLNPRTFVRDGPIIDLVAWHPRDAEGFALRQGAAEWLGCIEPQYLEPGLVPVRRSVLSWFRAGCTGLVLLSEAAGDQYRILSCCRRILAEDTAQAVGLRKMLQHPWGAPPVAVAKPGSRRYAA